MAAFGGYGNDGVEVTEVGKIARVCGPILGGDGPEIVREDDAQALACLGLEAAQTFRYLVNVADRAGAVSDRRGDRERIIGHCRWREDEARCQEGEGASGFTKNAHN